MSWDKLAILIPTRNRPAILATTLEELGKAGLGEAAIWIYDDCSENPDAIRKVVAARPHGQVIRSEKRTGQAQGRNVLMRACGKEFGLMLDDDTFPAAGEGLEGHLGERHGTKGRPAIVSFPYKSMGDGRLSTPASVPAGPAHSFLGGGSLFHIPSVLEAGGYRESFIYGYEEPELALRLWLKGRPIWYDPKVVINHNHFELPNERRDHREYDYLYARNGILMSSLNMPIWFGLPHGLGRSLRRSSLNRRNIFSKVKGTLAGMWLSFSLWQERYPCSIRQAVAWCGFNRRPAR